MDGGNAPAFFIGFFRQQYWMMTDTAPEQNEAHQNDSLGLQDAWETAPHLMAPGPAAPLLSLVAPVVQDIGLELLRIRMTGQDGEQVLQFMAERRSSAPRRRRGRPCGERRCLREVFV